MSRPILILLAIVALVLVVLLATGVLNVDQTRNAEIPNISAEGGQLPTFDVDTNGAALDDLGDDISGAADQAADEVSGAADDAADSVRNVDVDADVDVDTNTAN